VLDHLLSVTAESSAPHAASISAAAAATPITRRTPIVIPLPSVAGIAETLFALSL